MSQPLTMQDSSGVIAKVPGRGVMYAVGTTVPSDGAKGYGPGCLFQDADASAGATIWINEGTESSAAFKNLATSLGRSSAVVNVTSSTLTVTEASHNNRIMVLNRAAGVAVTLPAAAAGLRFRFIVGTTFTGAASISSVSGADIMVGHALMGNNSDNTVVDWQALSASTYDTIDLFGTANSTGGIEGQEIEIIGLAANKWFVSIRGDAAGTEATPFADAVA